ncbi:cytosine/adenosine deaminase-related metal-dependent hydrolase [Rhodococcus wratislaviensis]|uniref:Amidase n=1 Tax=Rhodococcus wratislaviensis TaxID=44752 RepID=A0AB38FIR0_RHOWR|nr:MULTISPECIES: amidohydrolase family protein [Rhodococcus]REE73527.1 cytosine/adenosine deaminase-related metal-dependent hydrolase [Rhodococcus wratislaviensis]WAM17326.1 amidohydrolase family protein [Rhodococcus sp. JS3073]SPZ41386.1 amidase [Rhodococcus wratislaviensis]
MDPSHARPRRTLLRGATVVSVDPAIGNFDRADILISDDLIAEIDSRIDVGSDVEVVDVDGMIALPGFVDTHRHTWQSVMRHGYAELDPLQYFDDMLRGIGAAYEPEDVRVGNLLGAVSALSSGTTTLFDWSHIQNSAEHSDAAVTGLREAGIRAVFGHGWPLLDDGRWTENSTLPHPADIERLQKEHFSDPGGLVTLAMAARGPEMAAPGVWQADLALARDLGIRTSVHAGAYAHNEPVHAVAQYGEAGLLADDLTFVHCCRSSDAELEMIAETGATVSIGVHCELNSQGIGDIPLDRMLAAGVRPSLSGDTETKCSGDMFTQMRMLFGYHRSWMGGGHSSVAADQAQLLLHDVLAFATIEGARAIGQGDRIGSLTPGKQADIILVRATDLNVAPVLDPVASAVLAAHEGNVDSVLVGGRFVKRAGAMIGCDPSTLVNSAAASQRRILGRRAAR